ncbi:MAG: PQQ-binding-like beta-propeller repeat protein [Candidatus Aenigmatarchaeota archaeon]
MALMGKIVFFMIIFMLPVFVIAEDKPDLGTLGSIPKLTDAEKVDAPELYSSTVYPSFGTPCMNFTYRVYYKDSQGRPPAYVKIWHDYKWYNMTKESGNYASEAMYTFNYVPTSGKELFYYIEASNGVGKARAAIIDSPDQGPLLYAEKLDNNEIILLDNNGNKLWSYETKNDWVEGVALSDDGRYAAAVTGYAIYLFSNSSNETLIKWKLCDKCDVPKVTMAGFNGVDISGDGRYMAGTLGTTLYYFDTASRQLLWKTSLEANVIGVSMSDDGGRVAVGLGNADNKGDKVILFNSTGGKLWEYKAPNPGYTQTGNFYKPDITSDGSYTAVSSGCPDRRAYLFSNNGELLFMSEMLTRDSPVHESAISDNGEYIAYVADQEQGKPNLFLFSKSGRKIWEFSSPDDATARSVSISSDGKYIASGTLSGNVYLFSSESNAPLWKFSESGDFRKIGDLKLSPDGRFLAAGSSSKKIYLFSINSSKPLWEYTAPTYVTFVDFNGKYVVAGTGVRQFVFEGNSASTEEVQCSEITQMPYVESADSNGASANNTAPSYCGNGICENWAESKDICAQDCCPDCNNKNTQSITGNNTTKETGSPRRNLENKNFLEIIIDFFRNLFGTK